MSNQYKTIRVEQKQAKLEYYKEYYKKIERLSLPQDYFDQVKRQLGREFNQMYVEKDTCARFCGMTLNHLTALREQIIMLNERLDRLEHEKTISIEVEEEPQQFATIPEEEATIRISEYVDSHPGTRTSDIICDLGIEPNLALKILRKLQAEDKIAGKQIERK